MDKREAVKELYKKAYKNDDYAGFEVWENIGQLFLDVEVTPPFPNSSVICVPRECVELKKSVQDEIKSLGFSLEYVHHKHYTDGYVGYGRCYVKWQGQHLSREDLFLDRIKELAELLGYDVRSVSKPPYWGIYGDTLDEALDNLVAFSNEVGLKWRTAEVEKQDSGYVYFVKFWRLNACSPCFQRTSAPLIYTGKMATYMRMSRSFRMLRSAMAITATITTLLR